MFLLNCTDECDGVGGDSGAAGGFAPKPKKSHRKQQKIGLQHWFLIFSLYPMFKSYFVIC